MKAFVYGASGAGIEDLPRPVAGDAQVLVRVRACGLNRADLGTVRGLTYGSAGGVGKALGMELAGEVVEVGSGTIHVAVGDHVMGSGQGALAEYALLDHGRLFKIPDNMGFDVAASLPIALTTMHNALIVNGELRTGQSVLVQGASSNVGLMALQIAKLKGVKTVIGSSTDPARRVRLHEFGADVVIDSTDPRWVDEVLHATNDAGVDLVIDQVSGQVANQNLAATRILGTIVNVGRLSGSIGDFNFDLHAARRIRYIGVTFRSRSIEEIREIFVQVKNDIWPDVETGKLRLPISSTFAFVDTAKAFAYMEESQGFGKIIVTV